MERRNNDVPVVFLLDTSSSVKGEGIAQIKEAFRSIIKGKGIFLKYTLNYDLNLRKLCNVSPLFQLYHDYLYILCFFVFDTYLYK